MCTCKRCGDEINKVYWFDGAAYGSTCIKAVAGTKHGIKVAKYVEVTAKSVREPLREDMGHRVTFTARDSKGKSVTLMSDHAVKNGAIHIDGNRWYVLSRFIPKGYTI